MEMPRRDEVELRVHQLRTQFDGKVKHTETGELFDVFRPRYDAVEELGVRGIYEHYKSTPDDRKLYFAENAYWDTETGECYVVYFPLYESDEEAASARPLNMFMESVESEAGKAPRFQRLNPNL